MKTFYYSKTEKNVNFGTKVTVKIYKFVKKEPILLLIHSFNTASTKGEQSEVLNALANNGEIPEKYATLYSHSIPYKAYCL